MTFSLTSNHCLIPIHITSYSGCCGCCRYYITTMAPRSALATRTTSEDAAAPATTAEKNKKTRKEEGITEVIHPKNKIPPYVRCNSSHAFLNPVSDDTKTPKQVNEELNLNLGLPPTLLDPNNSRLRRFIRFINDWCVSWWEDYVFAAWNLLPLRLKQKLTFISWAIYYPLHRALLGRSTAIHQDASEEYHALTTILWWSRLFPVTIKRMRFSLRQLTVWTKSTIQSRIERIHEPYDHNIRSMQVPEEQEQHCTIEGIYIHTQHDDTPTTKVIFWLYGGAFLSGDVDGNTGPAEVVGRTCGMDVFLPTYRLLPECAFDDMLWDVALAYSWLIHVKQMDPQNVILFGISSGSGLAMRLLQLIAELSRQEELEPPYLKLLLSPDIMPGGAVLMCPFVDYTEPKGTFAEYDQHDLIVNQSVMEVGIPYLEKTLGSHENRKRASPVYRNMTGLPPLCVVVSEHEVVYDQTILLVNQARKAGVPVTLGVWKFMCHAFCFLSSFVPEGQQSMDFVCDWIIQTHGASNNDDDDDDNENK